MKFMKCSNYKREKDEDGPGLRNRYNNSLRSKRKTGALELAIWDKKGPCREISDGGMRQNLKTILIYIKSKEIGKDIRGKGKKLKSRQGKLLDQICKY